MWEALNLFIAAIDLVFLILIWKDDRAQRQLAERALEQGRESLEAQKEYLALRRKWYESRTRREKKEPKAEGEIREEVGRSHTVVP